MTTFAQRRPLTTGDTADRRVEELAAAPMPVPELHPSPALALRVSRPTSTAIVVHVAGELDTETTPRLHELLAPRLASAAEAVIIDLSELRFLGVTGLELLAHAHNRATCRGMALGIVGGPVCVDRALQAAGWSATTPTYVGVAAALADLTGRRHRIRAAG